MHMSIIVDRRKCIQVASYNVRGWRETPRWFSLNERKTQKQTYFQKHTCCLLNTYRYDINCCRGIHARFTRHFYRSRDLKRKMTRKC